MRKIFLLAILIFSITTVIAQTYTTRNGFIGFYSKTDLEDIKAEHKQVYGVIDATAKKLAFTLLVKGFTFRKQLMQEHFNENYMESDKFPKASFSGSYAGDVAPGINKVQVKGILTLHGISKEIEVPATLELINNKLAGKSSFKINPADYNIKIPSLVRDKIARLIDVTLLIDANAK